MPDSEGRKSRDVTDDDRDSGPAVVIISSLTTENAVVCCTDDGCVVLHLDASEQQTYILFSFETA